jgi:hypothetical protein
VSKQLSLKALESAIQTATSLDELKKLVAVASVEKFMNADGTIRGLVFCNPSKTRGAVLQVAIKRGSPDGFMTSMIVDGKDFRAVYREMVKAVAGHFGIAGNSDLIGKMHGSVEAFLAKYGLQLAEVRYEQVTRVNG